MWSRCFLKIMQFFTMTIHPYAQPEVFNLGLRNIKTPFNIFSGQQIVRLTSLALDLDF